MAAHVHLPEPVLGVDEPLCGEQIVDRVGVDVRDAERIAVDVDRAVEQFDPHRAIGLRPRAADGVDPDDGRGDQRKRGYQQESEQRSTRPAHGTAITQLAAARSSPCVRPRLRRQT